MTPFPKDDNKDHNPEIEQMIQDKIDRTFDESNQAEILGSANLPGDWHDNRPFDERYKDFGLLSHKTDFINRKHLNMTRSITEQTPNDPISEPNKQPSFGQKLVGITFNPSGDDKVGRAKELCASLADMLNEELAKRETSELDERIFNHAIGELLNAQMCAVKYLTLKY